MNDRPSMYEIGATGTDGFNPDIADASKKADSGREGASRPKDQIDS